MSLLNRLFLGREGAARSAAVDRRLQQALHEREGLYAGSLEHVSARLLETTAALEARAASVPPPPSSSRPPRVVTFDMLSEEGEPLELGCGDVRDAHVIIDGLSRGQLATQYKPQLEATADGEIWAPLATLASDGFYAVPPVVQAVRLKLHALGPGKQSGMRAILAGLL